LKRSKRVFNFFKKTNLFEIYIIFKFFCDENIAREENIFFQLTELNDSFLNTKNINVKFI